MHICRIKRDEACGRLRPEGRENVLTGSAGNDTAGAVVAVAPVAAAERADLHAAVGCVDELTAADIDAHMPQTGEEHHVAGLEGRAGNELAHAILGNAAVGQGDAVVAIDLHGQTRAVGAGAAGTAVDIADAHKGHGIVHHGAAQGAAPGNHTGAEGLGCGGVAAGEDLDGSLAAADIDTYGEYRVTVYRGGTEIGTDIQGVIDASDPFDIDPHPSPEDEAITEDTNGNGTVTYTPVVVKRGTSTQALTTTFYFVLKDAAGVYLNSQADRTTPVASYSVTRAHCAQAGGDVSVTITSKD